MARFHRRTSLFHERRIAPFASRPDPLYSLTGIAHSAIKFIDHEGRVTKERKAALLTDDFVFS